MHKICFIIKPYFNNGECFFDYPKFDIKSEGLTCGTPEVILRAYEVNSKENQTSIGFSDKPVGKHRLDFVEPERDGSRYFWQEQNMHCWFCPTLLRYFNKPPKNIWFEILSF